MGKGGRPGGAEARALPVWAGGIVISAADVILEIVGGGDEISTCNIFGKADIIDYNIANCSCDSYPGL